MVRKDPSGFTPFQELTAYSKVNSFYSLKLILYFLNPESLLLK